MSWWPLHSGHALFYILVDRREVPQMGVSFHDARVHDLEIPDGKYYLADAAIHVVMYFCAISVGSVSPPEWETSGLRYGLDHGFLTYYNPELLDRPQNYKSSIIWGTPRHATLLQRIFGVAKNAFSILMETNEYPCWPSQDVSACGVTHNFIRTFDPDDMPEPVSLRDIPCSVYRGSWSRQHWTPGDMQGFQSRERILQSNVA